MPAPRLDVTVRDALVGIRRLESFRNESAQLANPVHQYLIAELIMLRLFSIVESSIESLACKLVAGAPYVNGNQPARLFVARSIDGAKKAMLSYGRPRPWSFLRWTTTQGIVASTSQVLDPGEPFIGYARAHSLVLDEMRKVRNFLAHQSTQSRAGYREVVRANYGANSRIKVESFLTSRRRLPRAKIDDYLSVVRIIISDLARG